MVSGCDSKCPTETIQAVRIPAAQVVTVSHQSRRSKALWASADGWIEASRRVERELELMFAAFGASLAPDSTHWLEDKNLDQDHDEQVFDPNFFNAMLQGIDASGDSKQNHLIT